MTAPRNLAEPVMVEGPADELLEACLPVAEEHRAHGPDGLEALLETHRSHTGDHIWVAAATGNRAAAARFLADDPALANRRGGTRSWEPLLYLCFSRVLRTDEARAREMIVIAELLLDAGADPNAYWTDPAEAAGNRETPLYGAAGIANRPELAALLVERGADPNDGETAYHMVEHPGVPTAEVIFPLLEPLHRGIALGHLLDYDDLAGLRKLLALGADPNGPTPFPNHPLHQAVWRNRTRPFFEALVEHGADPDLRGKHGRTAYAMAARVGNRRVMEWLVELGADARLEAPDDFLAACALGEEATARARLEHDPNLLEKLSPVDRGVICEAAAVGNLTGLRTMLRVGWDVDTRGTVWGETPLHRAALDGQIEVVEFLLQRGADPTIRDRCYRADAAGWADHSGHAALATRIRRPR